MNRRITVSHSNILVMLQPNVSSQLYSNIILKKGIAAAQYSLALCYLFSYGTPKDIDKSIQYFEMATYQGHLTATVYIPLNTEIECFWWWSIV